MFKRLDMMKKRDQRGFTLIELLIVIAIIAILAAIAIPQYSQYRKQAAGASGTSELSTCVNLAVANFANNGATSLTGCKVGDGAPTITVDATNGAVTMSTTSVNVKSQLVSCSIDGNGRPICQ